MLFLPEHCSPPRGRSGSSGLAARRRTLGAGFSLVEVVIALGIAVFALVAVVGLLPVGFAMARESEEESRAVNLLSSVVADRLSSPFDFPSRQYAFPSLTNAPQGFFDVGEDGLPAAEHVARYRIRYLVTSPAEASVEPYRVWLRVSQPAKSADAKAIFETVASFPQP